MSCADVPDNIPPATVQSSVWSARLRVAMCGLKQKMDIVGWCLASLPRPACVSLPERMFF